MSNQKFESQIKIFYNTMKKYEEKGDTQMACNNQLMAYGYIIGSYDAGVITEEEKNEAEHLMGFRSFDSPILGSPRIKTNRARNNLAII